MKHSATHLLTHWRLLLRVTKSELKSRYAGSSLGAGWAVITPILMLLIYAAVYLLVLRIKVPSLSSAEYVVLIFVGLVPFLMSSESLSSGVSSVVANKSVLSNTVFPVDLVPAKAVLMAQITMVSGFSLVLVAALFLGLLKPVIILFPFIWALQVLFLIGLLWILSLVNLIFRDLQNLIGILIMYLMIASPIGYTREMVPPGLKFILAVNPLAHFIVAYQDIIVFGRPPTMWNMFGIVVMSLSLFFAGGYFFAHAKRTFVDYV